MPPRKEASKQPIKQEFFCNFRNLFSLRLLFSYLKSSFRQPSTFLAPSFSDVKAALRAPCRPAFGWALTSSFRSFFLVRVGFKVPYSIVKYFFPVAHSSWILIPMEITNLSQDSMLGKSPATLVLLFCSLFILSTGLTVLIFFQCASG